MTSKPVFLLGVGCQKGGTTWLHHYLQSHPQADLGIAKEYHFFNGMYATNGQAVRKYFEQQFADTPPGSEEYPRLHKQLEFFTRPDTYYQYFAELAKQQNVHLAGDITPAYAMLDVSTYALAKTRLEEMGFNVKVVFILRDPLERIWSAIRMHKKIYPQNFSDKPTQASDDLAIMHEYNKWHIEVRTRYERTIQNLESVFSPDALHYIFYEEFPTPETVAPLCQFLEIDYQPRDFDIRVNNQMKSGELSPKTKETVINHYAQTYQFVEHKFGSARVRDLWPNASYVEASG